MALELGELNAVLKTDNTRLKVGLAEAERDTKASGDRMQRDAQASAASMTTTWIDRLRSISGAWRTHTGQITIEIDQTRARLRELVVEYDRIGGGHVALRQIAEVRSHLAALEQAAAAAAQVGVAAGTGMFNSMGTAASAAASSMTGLLGTLALLVALIPVIIAAGYVLVGTLAAVVPAAGGAAVVIATMILGLRGLVDAFRDSGKAGGTVIDRAYQIEAAERRLRDAQRESTRAQDDLTRAREQYAERVEDLARTLTRAQLDERSAVLGVAEAREALRRAQVSGDRLSIERARLAYESAVLAVDEARDRVSDLAAEHETAANAGVEGSDEVTAALERQERAIAAIRDAEHALAQARRSSGGGVAAEAVKLAPAAQQVVDLIKGWKGAWDALGLNTQQRLMSGWAGEIRSLAATWLPSLRERIGGVADMFNGLFKLWSSSASKPEFVSGVNTGMAALQTMIGRVASSLAGPFMDAWGRLSRAASPFLIKLGDEIGTMIDEFSAWIKRMDDTGSLDHWFGDASDWLHDTVSGVKALITIFASLFSIITHPKTASLDGVLGRAGQTTGGGLADMLKNLADWFKDPENQTKVSEFVDKIKDFASWAVSDGAPAVMGLVDKIDTVVSRIDTMATKVSDVKDRIATTVDTVVAIFTGLPTRISSASTGLFAGIPNAFRAAMNWIIGKWNNLSFQLPSITAFGQQVGGGRLDTEDIKFLADGGLVRRTPGGRVVGVGEGDDDEIVSPVDMMRRIVREESRAGGGTLTIVLETRGLVRTTRRQIRYDGGDVEASMGAEY